MLLGSHLSVAGGLHHALEASRGYGFEALALFVRSPRQWSAPPLDADEVARFRQARSGSGVRVIVAHASYLLNLAGGDDLRRKSVEALADDLQRCDALGIEYLVLHPGSHPDRARGLPRIVAGLNEAMGAAPRRRVKLLIESTAGQGNSIGHTFEDLADILRGVRRRARFGVCLDTCHLYAAGYDVASAKAWRATLRSFDRVVGLHRLHAVHCNDSLKPFGSRVDRHAHIGEGTIGLEGFRAVVNDRRLRDVPLILETPKGTRESDGRDWDEVNAGVLRRLAGGRAG